MFFWSGRRFAARKNSTFPPKNDAFEGIDGFYLVKLKFFHTFAPAIGSLARSDEKGMGCDSPTVPQL